MNLIHPHLLCTPSYVSLAISRPCFEFLPFVPVLMAVVLSLTCSSTNLNHIIYMQLPLKHSWVLVILTLQMRNQRPENVESC